MPYKTIQQGIEFAIAAIDGAYGWISETIALALVVLIFNFVIGWLLQRLHYRFESQKKIWQDSFVRALYKPLSYYIWFFALVHILDLIAYRIFTQATLENMHRVLAVGAIFAVAWFFLRWKKNVVQFMIMKSKNHEITLDLTKIDVIDKIVTILILFITVLLFLEIIERSVNTLIAFGGVGGLAIAFASQEMIANFFAGLMIYTTHPFSKGEWIHIPERNIEGHVEEIGWYMTRIKSLDKRPLYVPNSVFSKVVVFNPSRMSHRQIKETLSLRFADMPVLKAVIADIKTLLQHHPDLDRYMPIMVHFIAFGSYSLDIQLQAFSPIVETDSFLRVKDDVLTQIAAIIAKHGAEFAFPTSNVLLPHEMAVR